MTRTLSASPSINPAVKVRLHYNETDQPTRWFGVRKQSGLFYPYESFNGRGDYKYFGEHGTLEEAVEQIERLVDTKTIIAPLYASKGWSF